MLIVPPIEIDVECHNAAGDHACDQCPAEGEKKKKPHRFGIRKRIQLPEQDGVSVGDRSMNELLKCVFW